MGTCKNCQAEISLNYCPNCGLPGSLNRIDGQYLLHEIRTAINFEKGFLYTIKGLATKPGASIKAFLYDDRSRMIKPVIFLILTSIVYSVLNNILQFEANYVNLADNNGSTSFKLLAWVQSNYGYANLIMAVFIGLWTRLFFFKYKINLFEILVILCYVMGMGMLIYTVFGLIQSLTQSEMMQLASFAGFTYTTWAIGQFFGKRDAINYIYAFLSYFLGMITFFIVMFMIGIGIDLLT